MSLPPYLTLRLGDIIQESCDAIANAANRTLSGGGGVDGAIHRAAGQAELSAACAALGGCPTGQAKATPAFKLNAKHIIHAVGPRYRPGAENRVALASAYTESLRLAASLGCKSIAFPAISCGVYQYPPKEATKVARDAIMAFQGTPDALADIRLVFFKEELRSLAEKVWS